MQEIWVQSLGWEDPLEKAKAPYSNILAQGSPWGHKESNMTERFQLYYIFKVTVIKTVYYKAIVLQLKFKK